MVNSSANQCRQNTVRDLHVHVRDVKVACTFSNMYFMHYVHVHVFDIIIITVKVLGKYYIA